MPIEFWTGGEFDTTHERLAQEQIIKSLSAYFGEDGSTIIAAFNITAGEDLDLLILKRDAIVIVDFKECSQAIHATENGSWKIEGGGRLQNNNPYRQIRKFRYALNDFLFKHREQYLRRQKASMVDDDKSFLNFISCMVAICPRLHPESTNGISPAEVWFHLSGLDMVPQRIAKITGKTRLKLDDVEARALISNVLHCDQLRAEHLRKERRLVESPSPYYVPSTVRPAPNSYLFTPSTSMATSLGSFVDICIAEPHTAGQHLCAGYFEPWLRESAMREDLADLAHSIRMRSRNRRRPIRTLREFLNHTRLLDECQLEIINLGNKPASPGVLKKSEWGRRIAHVNFQTEHQHDFMARPEVLQELCNHLVHMVNMVFYHPDYEDYVRDRYRDPRYAPTFVSSRLRYLRHHLFLTSPAVEVSAEERDLGAWWEDIRNDIYTIRYTPDILAGFQELGFGYTKRSMLNTLVWAFKSWRHNIDFDEEHTQIFDSLAAIEPTPKLIEYYEICKMHHAAIQESETILELEEWCQMKGYSWKVESLVDQLRKEADQCDVTAQ